MYTHLTPTLHQTAFGISGGFQSNMRNRTISSIEERKTDQDIIALFAIKNKFFFFITLCAMSIVSVKEMMRRHERDCGFVSATPPRACCLGSRTLTVACVQLLGDAVFCARPEISCYINQAQETATNVGFGSIRSRSSRQYQTT
jgi:hypothetical protein